MEELTFRNGLDAATVNDLLEACPANRACAHRAGLPISVEREILPSPQYLLGRQSLALEDICTVPYGCDLPVHCGIWSYEDPPDYHCSPPVVPTAFAVTQISSSEVVLTIADPKGA